MRNHDLKNPRGGVTAALWALAVLAGCGAPVAGDAGPDAAVVPSVDAAADVPPAALVVGFYRGTYAVPGVAVGPYDVPELHWVTAGDQVVLSYNLPRLLVGQRVGVALAGTLSADRSHATLAGAGGTATCTTRPADGAPVRCDERFVGLAVDLAGVAREAARVDPGAADALVAAAQRFASDPIGVLDVAAALPTPPGARACRADAECASLGVACRIEAAGIGLCE